MISFELSDEQKQMQDTAHKFAETEMRAQDETYRRAEEAQAAPEAMVAGYRENGFGLIDLPEEVGGLGLDMVTRTIVEEELAWGDAGLALALDRAGTAAAAICALGTAAQRRKLLGNLLEEPKTLALCLSEDDIGSDTHATIATTAKGGKLSGTKRWVIHAPEADLFVVFARVSDEPGWAGVRAFAVQKGAAGLSIGETDERLGVLTAKTATVTFENTPAEELGGADDYAAAIEGVLNRRRALTAARLVGIARAAAEYSRDYATQRPAFGKVIAQFQSIAFMIADAATEVNSARWLAWKAARAVDRGEAATKAAAIALTHASDVANRVTVDGVQILGGAGFIQDYPVEKWMRDARQLSLQCGIEALHNALVIDATLGAA